MFLLSQVTLFSFMLGRCKYMPILMPTKCVLYHDFFYRSCSSFGHYQDGPNKVYDGFGKQSSYAVISSLTTKFSIWFYRDDRILRSPLTYYTVLKNPVKSLIVQLKILLKHALFTIFSFSQFFCLFSSLWESGLDWLWSDEVTDEYACSLNLIII